MAAMVGPSQLASKPEPKAPPKACLGLHRLQKSLLSPCGKKKAGPAMLRRRAGLDRNTSLKMCHMVFLYPLLSWMRIKYCISEPRYGKLDSIRAEWLTEWWMAKYEKSRINVVNLFVIVHLKIVWYEIILYSLMLLTKNRSYIHELTYNQVIK